MQQLQAEKAAATKAPATPKPPRSKRGADSKLPPRDSVPNPYASLTFDPPGIERYQLRRTFKGHVNAVSAAAFHPHKPILATVSDDATWKLWSVPNCDLVMSGEGHRDWISGVDFHPAGSHLATASGDRTVKIWDFAGADSVYTFAATATVTRSLSPQVPPAPTPSRTIPKPSGIVRSTTPVIS